MGLKILCEAAFHGYRLCDRRGTIGVVLNRSFKMVVQEAGTLTERSCRALAPGSRVVGRLASRYQDPRLPKTLIGGQGRLRLMRERYISFFTVGFFMFLRARVFFSLIDRSKNVSSWRQAKCQTTTTALNSFGAGDYFSRL